MTPSPSSETTALAQQSSRTVAVICFMVAALALLGWSINGGISLLPWVWALGGTALVLLAAWFLPAPSLARSTVICLLAAGIDIFASAVTTQELAHSGRSFEAFSGYKLAAITAAIMAPLPYWKGYLILAVCAIAPVAQYFALEPRYRVGFSVQEPWLTVVFIAIALLIFRFRLHSKKLEQSLTQMQAERTALKDKAMHFAVLQDLVNTPLQSIELASSLLEANVLSPREGSRFLKSSLRNLQTLTKALAAYQDSMEWSSGAAAFDAESWLDANQRSLTEVPLGR